MAKAATQFACTDCGYSAGRWFGKCPACGEFGTLVEEATVEAKGATAARPTLRLIDVKAEEAERIPTGISELEFRDDWTTLHRMNSLIHLADGAAA